MKRFFKPSVVVALTGSTALCGAASAQDSENPFSVYGLSSTFSLEYEDKHTTDYNGVLEFSDKTVSAEIGNLYANFPMLGLDGFYSLKHMHKWGDRSDGNESYDTKGWKHLLFVNKKFQLGDGFTAGLGYELEYELGKRDQYAWGTSYSGLSEKRLDQYLKPSLSYWSNEGNWGFYSHLEFLNSAEDKDVWWSGDDYQRDENGVSLLFRPYTQMGNWKLEAELFHQIKDGETRVGSTLTQTDDYTETYIQPGVSYSFDNAGVLSMKARFGKKETELTGGAWATAGEKYMTDVRKLTLGYEQNVGNWQIKAEWERSWESETTNGAWAAAGASKEIVQDKFYVGGQVRF